MPTAKLVAELVQPLPLPIPLIDAQVAFAVPAAPNADTAKPAATAPKTAPESLVCEVCRCSIGLSPCDGVTVVTHTVFMPMRQTGQNSEIGATENLQCH
jgi:hypothetical protein